MSQAVDRAGCVSLRSVPPKEASVAVVRKVIVARVRRDGGGGSDGDGKEWGVRGKAERRRVMVIVRTGAGAAGVFAVGMTFLRMWGNLPHC